MSPSRGYSLTVAFSSNAERNHDDHDLMLSLPFNELFELKSCATNKSGMKKNLLFQIAVSTKYDIKTNDTRG